jgi:hypothetical protein
VWPSSPRRCQIRSCGVCPIGDKPLNGMIDEPVYIGSYDAAWPSRFLEEQQILIEVLTQWLFVS